MLKELKKNKMSVVATGILFGVMGILIIPMIAVIIKYRMHYPKNILGYTSIV